MTNVRNENKLKPLKYVSILSLYWVLLG